MSSWMFFEREEGLREVEKGVETGEPHDLGLAPPDHRPQESGLALRKTLVHPDPHSPRSLVPFDLGAAPRVVDRLAEPPEDRGEVNLVYPPALREDSGPLDA